MRTGPRVRARSLVTLRGLVIPTLAVGISPVLPRRSAATFCRATFCRDVLPRHWPAPAFQSLTPNAPGSTFVLITRRRDDYLMSASALLRSASRSASGSRLIRPSRSLPKTEKTTPKSSKTLHPQCTISRKTLGFRPFSRSEKKILRKPIHSAVPDLFGDRLPPGASGNSTPENRNHQEKPSQNPNKSEHFRMPDARIPCPQQRIRKFRPKIWELYRKVPKSVVEYSSA